MPYATATTGQQIFVSLILLLAVAAVVVVELFLSFSLFFSVWKSPARVTGDAFDVERTLSK